MFIGYLCAHFWNCLFIYQSSYLSTIAGAMRKIARTVNGISLVSHLEICRKFKMAAILQNGCYVSRKIKLLLIKLKWMSTCANMYSLPYVRCFVNILLFMLLLFVILSISDTAGVYKNEEDIGSALKELCPKYGLTRSDLFITSKLGKCYKKYWYLSIPGAVKFDTTETKYQVKPFFCCT